MVRVIAAILAPLALMLAQQSQQSTTSGTSNSSSSQNSGNNSNTGSTSTASQARQGKELGAYLSGRVIMDDGSAMPAAVVVRRMCGSSVTAEAFPDSSGYFLIRLGSNQAFMGDASSPGGFRQSEYQLAPGFTGKGGGNPMPNTQNDCELRAMVSGYRSEGLSLAGMHPTDSGDIGAIILHRQVAAVGYATSATTVLAPKNARKSYRKGLDAVRHQDPDEAQKNFLRSVEIFPRFAEAWYELGRIYDQRVHSAEARAAYNKAIAADGHFVKPYEGLALLDVKEQLWAQAAEASGKVLGLDPVEFPRAYYINALANFETHHLQLAERSARRAVEVERDSANPQAEYLLGMILAQEGQRAEAAANLRAYLAAGGSPESVDSARRMLARIENPR